MIKRVIKKLIKSPWVVKYTESVQAAYCSGTVTNNSIEGKTVCISGATGDIGDAMVRRFLCEGCNLVVIGRSDTKLSELKNKYDTDSRIETLLIDLSDAESIEKVYGEYLTNHKIDVLINNAGVLGGAREKRFRTVSKEELLNTWNVNIKSAELLSKLTINSVQNTGLTIVNISSICSQFNSFRYSPYGISKSALIGLTKDINNKFSSKGVYAKCILPGSVATKMGNIKVGDNIVGNNNVLGRPALPEEIAALAAIYSSDIGRYCVSHMVASAIEKL